MLSTRTQAAFQRALAGTVSPQQLSQLGMATGNCNLPMEHRASQSNVHQNAFNNHNNYNGDYRYVDQVYNEGNNEFNVGGNTYNNPFNYFDNTQNINNRTINEILENYWTIHNDNSNHFSYEDNSIYDYSDNSYSYYHGGITENYRLGDTHLHSHPTFNNNNFYGGPVNHNYGPTVNEGDTHNYGDINIEGDTHFHNHVHLGGHTTVVNEEGDTIINNGPIYNGPVFIEGDDNSFNPTFINYGPIIIGGGGALPDTHATLTWMLTAEKLTDEHVKLKETAINQSYISGIGTLDVECDASGGVQLTGNLAVSSFTHYQYEIEVNDNRRRWPVVAFANSGSARHTTRGPRPFF